MSKRKADSLPNLKTPATNTSQRKTRQTAKKLKLASISDCDITNSAINMDQNSLNQISQLLDSKLSENAKTLHARFDNLDKSISLQNVKIGELETEVDTLKTTVTKMTQENELLWRELCKVNLVFCGIPERQNETNDELFDKVAKVIHVAVGRNINFDTAHRIGKSINHFARPIKVRFISLFERNEIYASRFNVKRPTFINEDLPHSLRKDYSEMRKKRTELIANGYDFKQIRMDWNRKVIRTGDAVFYVNQPGSSLPTSSGVQNLTTKSSTRDQGPKASGIGVLDKNKHQPNNPSLTTMGFQSQFHKITSNLLQPRQNNNNNSGASSSSSHPSIPQLSSLSSSSLSSSTSESQQTGNESSPFLEEEMSTS
jgi:hypothetical protein